MLWALSWYFISWHLKHALASLMYDVVDSCTIFSFVPLGDVRLRSGCRFTTFGEAVDASFGSPPPTRNSPPRMDILWLLSITCRRLGRMTGGWVGNSWGCSQPPWTVWGLASYMRYFTLFVTPFSGLNHPLCRKNPDSGEDPKEIDAVAHLGAGPRAVRFPLTKGGDLCRHSGTRALAR